VYLITTLTTDDLRTRHREARVITSSIVYRASWSIFLHCGQRDKTKSSIKSPQSHLYALKINSPFEELLFLVQRERRFVNDLRHGLIRREL